jgi:hypothetical protein
VLQGRSAAQVQLQLERQQQLTAMQTLTRQQQQQQQQQQLLTEAMALDPVERQLVRGSHELCLTSWRQTS